ncbi:MAG: alanine racemase [Pseudohongiellaceae bacterium]|jgi:alanine racemase
MVTANAWPSLTASHRRRLHGPACQGLWRIAESGVFMADNGHRVWAEIDLAALQRNLVRIGERLSTSEGGEGAKSPSALPPARVLVVLKADAYGHGAVPVARALEQEPLVWGFGVGDSNEALELRAAGIAAPILVLGTIIADEVPQVVSHDIRVCIHSEDRIHTLQAEAERQGRRTRVHLMVDTGMGRLGAQPRRAAALARLIEASPWLILEGVTTHPSPSRPGHPFITVQRGRLDALLSELSADGIAPPLVHFANTAAVLGGEGVELPLVRPGISLYGVLSHELSERGADFEPVMALRTQVVYLKDVPTQTPVGYNGTHVTGGPARIATLPIGYNDGLSYRLSNCGRALVRGQLAPIVGAISMDYTMLDVTAIQGVKVGDTVTLIGRDGERKITIPDLANTIGTIPYEVACAVGKRVRRVYVRDGAKTSNQRPSEATGDSQ